MDRPSIAMRMNWRVPGIVFTIPKNFELVQPDFEDQLCKYRYCCRESREKLEGFARLPFTPLSEGLCGFRLTGKLKLKRDYNELTLRLPVVPEFLPTGKCSQCDGKGYKTYLHNQSLSCIACNGTGRNRVFHYDRVEAFVATAYLLFASWRAVDELDPLRMRIGGRYLDGAVLYPHLVDWLLASDVEEISRRVTMAMERSGQYVWPDSYPHYYRMLIRKNFSRKGELWMRIWLDGTTRHDLSGSVERDHHSGHLCLRGTFPHMYDLDIPSYLVGLATLHELYDRSVQKKEWFPAAA